MKQAKQRLVRADMTGNKTNATSHKINQTRTIQEKGGATRTGATELQAEQHGDGCAATRAAAKNKLKPMKTKKMARMVQ